MIVDAILYAGERECLDIRYNELKDVVDKFVIVEADRTFTGKPRPRERLPINMNRRGFHSTVGIRSDIEDPWQREAYQRNAMLHALKHVAQSDDDIILIGDADEIPSAEAVKRVAKLAAGGAQIAFEQTLCTYYANVQCVNMRWRGTQAIRYDKLKDVTPQGVRDFRNHAPFIKDGGWHFSSLVLDDPVGRMTAKIQAFSHQEVNRPEVLAPANIRRRVAMCEDIQGRTDVQFEIKRDAKLPQYVEENKDKHELLFYPGSL
jgi:hypothetical protein